LSALATPIQAARPLRRASVFLFSFLGFLSVCCSLRAQSATGVVEGRIQDPVSGDYLFNARVIAIDTGREALTDSTGHYQLTGVPAGEVRLRISYQNFDDLTDTVQVTAGQVAVRDFSMTNRRRYGEDETIVLNAFVVAATREEEAAGIAISEQRFSPNVKNVLAADAFGDVSENNVGEFLKRMPGVTINYAEGDANSITLRGFPPEQTGITVDGNSIASASSSNPSRIVDLEQISVANTSRLEVVKTVLPNQWANSLGGTVNLISKSSFERSRPLLTARALVQFTNDDNSIHHTPGPGSSRTSKLRPGFQFSYINPVSKTLGFSVSASYSDQFGRRTGSQSNWDFFAADGGASPVIRSLRLDDNVRETKREAYGFGVDWRPLERLTLKLNYQYNTLDLFATPRFFIFNTGTNPVSSSPTGVVGRTNAGTVQHGSNWTHKSGETNYLALQADYRGRDWRIDGAVAYSRSENRYRNLDEGFLKGITARIPSPTLVISENAGPEAIGKISVTSGGAAVDWTRLDNYRIIESTGNEQRDGWVEDQEVRLNARRELQLGSATAAVQFGGAVKTNDRAREWTRRKFAFLGTDGKSNTADDNAAVVLDNNYGPRNFDYGWPRDIQWADLQKFHEIYKSNSGYFVPDLADDYTLEATADDGFKETLYALYTQGEVQLLANRLTLIGGVRWERTEDTGYGLKIDQTAGRNLTDPLERTKAQYLKRGARAAVSYDDFYPSAATTFKITENLLFRFGYSRTLGRPNIDNLIPRITESDTDINGYDGTLNVRNPALKPWTSDNFDVSLEYYFSHGGVASIGAFRKFIADPFGSLTIALDPELARQLGYDPDVYTNYRMVTTFNLPQSSRITGIEANYQQNVGTLIKWAEGLSVFANGTLLDYDGPREGDFGEMYEKTANWGASYNRGRVSVHLNWNHTGRRKTDNYTWAPDAARFAEARTTLDLGTEYRLTRNFWVFANARNLTNSLEKYAISSSNTPDYSELQQVADWGVKWSVGFRGRF
jgi:iron complex outermembrane recepter protein